MKRALILLSLAALLASCGTVVPKGTAASEAKAAPKFKMVQPPITLTDPQVVQRWLVDNYWSQFDMADTSFIGSDELKNGFAIYSMLLVNAERAHSLSAMIKLFKQAEAYPRINAELVRLGEGYLGDPNSEMRNDTLFLALLDYVIASPIYDSLAKIRPAVLKEATLKNQVGDRVGDFSWIDIQGGKGSLFAVKAPLTLLMFYTPGCETCKGLFAGINGDAQIKTAVDNGQLRLIAVYADEDREAWEQYGENIAPQWLNVKANGEFKTKRPFIIRATPSLYLLDRQKRVLVRDGVSPSQISEKL